MRLKRASQGDHLAYYSMVMQSDTARDPNAAIGSKSHRQRLGSSGEDEFTYLQRSGLFAEHLMLEIGCGNLRAGRLFINYLDAEVYYTGIDISPDIPEGRTRRSKNTD